MSNTNELRLRWLKNCIFLRVPDYCEKTITPTENRVDSFWRRDFVLSNRKKIYYRRIIREEEPVLWTELTKFISRWNYFETPSSCFHVFSKWNAQKHTRTTYSRLRIFMRNCKQTSRLVCCVRILSSSLTIRPKNHIFDAVRGCNVAEKSILSKDTSKMCFFGGF